MPTPPTGEPELIVTLRVGSVISGECSACHEVIVVKGIGAETPVEWVYTIEQGILGAHSSRTFCRSAKQMRASAVYRHREAGRY